jgi:hypothetical protein
LTAFVTKQEGQDSFFFAGFSAEQRGIVQDNRKNIPLHNFTGAGMNLLSNVTNHRSDR